MLQLMQELWPTCTKSSHDKYFIPMIPEKEFAELKKLNAQELI